MRYAGTRLGELTRGAALWSEFGGLYHGYVKHGGKQIEIYLDSQVAGNNRPLYPKVDRYWFKVAHNYEPLALPGCFGCYMAATWLLHGSHMAATLQIPQCLQSGLLSCPLV